MAKKIEHLFLEASQTPFHGNLNDVIMAEVLWSGDDNDDKLKNDPKLNWIILIGAEMRNW